MRRTLTPFERAAVEHIRRRHGNFDRGAIVAMVRAQSAWALSRPGMRLDGEIAQSHCAGAVMPPAALIVRPTSEWGAMVRVLAHAIVGASDCWWAVLANGDYAVAVRTPGGEVMSRHCAHCLEPKRNRTECKACGNYSTRLLPVQRPGRWYRAALTLTAEHRALLDAALAHGGEAWDVLGDALEADGAPFTYASSKVGVIRRGAKAPAAERWPVPGEWPANWRIA